ncbi:MAG: hypothetical protein EBR82_00460 [Caulobacteraceae bacterium]|jgi:spore coat polysaccharide biosynthesis protein SpsF (cytidylyltransferase family)|nr:hypothetical protein [Caulobacteraceae bacterium]
MHDYAIFVQARLGSKRFPKKVLQNLAGKRVLDHVINACHETGLETFLLVPYSDESVFKESFDVKVHAGPENDVLSRFVSCARSNGVSNVVRITSDCPCLPGSHISAVVDEHRKLGGFVTNVSYSPDSYESLTHVPDGFDVEIFTYDLLEEADRSSTEPKDREHVTSWMRKQKSINIVDFALSVEGKFSLDTTEDLDRLEKSYELLRSLKTQRRAPL